MTRTQITIMHQPQYDEALRINAEKYKTNNIKKGFELIELQEIDGIIHCSIKNTISKQKEKVTCKYLFRM